VVYAGCGAHGSGQGHVDCGGKESGRNEDEDALDDVWAYLFLLVVTQGTADISHCFD
jgi:hypothetical protein